MLLIQKLRKEWPWIFLVNKEEPIIQWGIECDIGWDDLIYRTISKLVAFDKEQQLRITQIKEKVGALIISTNIKSLQSAKYAIVLAAERESIKTCELCGVAGEKRNIDGLIKTLCVDCFHELI